MPLDHATLRFCSLLRRDMDRMTERAEERIARGEWIDFDPASGLALVHTRRGDLGSRLYGEVLAVYLTRDRILRWAWAGRSPTALPTHGDVLPRTGQARGVPQLAMSVVGELDQEDAAKLVKVGALVARAEGVLERRSGSDIEFIGLFDRARPLDAAQSPESRYSLPPPAVAASREEKRPSHTPSAAWSNLGAAGVGHSTVRLPPLAAAENVRQPSRALFLPVANAVLSALTHGSVGYRQALFLLSLDGQAPRRPTLHLSVVDAAGTLRALAAPPALVDVAVAMVDADRAEGNGSWAKLEVRITPKSDGGASLHVDVS